MRLFSRIPSRPRFLGERNSSSDGSWTYALGDRPLGRGRLETTTPFALCFADFMDVDFGGSTSGRSSTCFVAEAVASPPAEGSTNVECTHPVSPELGSTNYTQPDWYAVTRRSAPAAAVPITLADGDGPLRMLAADFSRSKSTA